MSRYISHLVSFGLFLGISNPRGMQPPSHFSYIVDILPFCYDLILNIKVILEAIKVYRDLSEIRVNWQKSCIYFGNGVRFCTLDGILSLTTMKLGGFSMVYLGVLYFCSVSHRW